MKLKFKVQPYQTHAVDSLADCFAGQPKSSGVSYRIDPGAVSPAPTIPQQAASAVLTVVSSHEHRRRPGRLSTYVNCQDLFPRMSEFAADRQSRLLVNQLLRCGQFLGSRPTIRWRSPAG